MVKRSKRWTACLVTAATLAFGGAAWAEQPTNVEAELKALRAEITALKAKEGETWLTQRRAEEVKALVREVLADADTRASLQEGGMTAGYNKGFFLASDDGNFYLKIGGQSQTRYIYNNTDHDKGDPEGVKDEDEAGFQQRRTKLTFEGHIFDPKFKYEITGAFSRSSGNLELEMARFEYEFADGWSVTGGTYKMPFLIEELMSSKRFQAVERSFVNDYFTIDYTQGTHLTWNATDNVKVTAGVHDGSYARSTEFNADSTELGVASRAELLLAGDWKQFSDYAAWSGQPLGLIVGAGVDWEKGEHGDGSDDFKNGNFPNVLKWTADVRMKLHPVNVFAAYIGQQIQAKGRGRRDPADEESATQHAFVLQAGVFLIPDKLDVFARYEWIDFDDAFYGGANGISSSSRLDSHGAEILAEADDLSIVTFGANYYFKRHDVKLTADVVWFLDPMPVSNTGAGMVQSSDNDQFAIRGQFQFLF